MDWVQTSHCSWDLGEMRIVKQYCKREGGVVYKLFDGEKVRLYFSLEDAKNGAING